MARHQEIPAVSQEYTATELEYHQHMQKLESEAIILATVTDGDRQAVLLDKTILYPQGGGQPADKGCINTLDGEGCFQVVDVQKKGDLVYHYGHFLDDGTGTISSFRQAQEVLVKVEAERRLLFSRLHTAGHLLDACVSRLGYRHLEPSKGHHFPDSPFVEYKGSLPKDEIETIRQAIELEANRLVKAGGPVVAVTADYEEALNLCGGFLPSYIFPNSRPRVVIVGGLGCPCGGTHVPDVAHVGAVKVPQIRVKKGMTKVSYNLL